MKKSELVKRIRTANPHLRNSDVTELFDIIFTEITKTLRKGGRVELRGFGVFETRERRSRIGRNPKTGALVNVPVRRVPFFKAGKVLRKVLNQK